MEISVDKNLQRAGRIVAMVLTFLKTLSLGLYWETVDH